MYIYEIVYYDFSKMIEYNTRILVSFFVQYATVQNWPSSTCKMMALVTYRYFHDGVVLFLKLGLSLPTM